MVSLDRFETFRAVVDCGSLSAAADTLGQTRAVVSFNLKRLEAELGVSLLSRSTRRMALTDAGERFYQRCVKVLDEARLAIDDARAEHGELRGSLRVTTTQEYGLRQLVPALQAFARLHPALQVQLSTSSLHADLIGERFDVAIRLGRLEDSTHHAVQLASFEVLAVVSPACLAALGEPPPTDLESLERLQNLGHSRLADSLPWQVRAPDGALRSYRGPRHPMLLADNAAALRAFALDGLGIAVLPDWLVQADLRCGALQRLLADHGFPLQGVHGLRRSRRTGDAGSVAVDLAILLSSLGGSRHVGAAPISIRASDETVPRPDAPRARARHLQERPHRHRHL
nr:LysR family transcriptional regulator [Pseudomonas aeruginosa]